MFDVLLFFKDIGIRECRLLQNIEARRYVKQKIKEKEANVIMKCSAQDSLQMYGETKEYIHTAIRILKSILKSTRLSLDKHAQAHLQTDCGRKHLEKLVDEYDGRLIYQIHGDDLYIVSVDYLHQEIIKKVKTFLDSHSYLEETVLFDSGVFLYLFNNKKRDVQQVIKQYKDLNVEIDIVDRETRKGFTVKGDKQVCKIALAQLNSIKDNVIRTDMNVSDEFFHKFLQRPEGMEKMKNIQLAEKCIIQIPMAIPERGCRQRSENILAKSKFGHCDLQIKGGDITDQIVDFIVNPTDRMLEHKRGLGRTLVDKGLNILFIIICFKKGIN
jgi:hypothetical protein